jgi:hypothetical protein
MDNNTNTINSNNEQMNNIEDMYKNISYFDQYGSSVFLFTIITIIFSLLVSYIFVMIRIQPIKDDWVNKRCDPYVIPFAGLINRPPGKGIREYTQENFNYCTQSVLQGVTGQAVQPLTFITLMITKLFYGVEKSINAARSMFDKVRSSVKNVSEEIMGRIMNITTPLIQIIMGLKDMLYKTQGVMTSALYTLLGSYYTLNSLMGAIAQFIVKLLIILATLIAALWIAPFTWGAAAANTAVFIGISIPFILILAFMSNVLKVKTGFKIPRLKCFDEKTQVLMNDGTLKYIEDINVGDILLNGNKVTSKIKVTRESSLMYNLNGVIVSDSHLVFHDNNWIRVSEHPRAFLIPKYNNPYIYCLNTRDKTILLNGIIFADWDDILFDGRNYEILKNKIITEKGIYNYTKSDYHRYLNGGLYEKTQVELFNGTKKDISAIKIGDVLKGNNFVYGVVEIDGFGLSELCEYHLGKKSFVGGPNINCYNDESLLIRTFYLKQNEKTPIMNHEKKLYHLLTTNNFFYINNSIKCLDYNSLVDLFFNK